MPKRHRKWTFTINNPLLELYPEKLDFCKKYVYQLEIGDNKTEHLQGCLELVNNKTLSALKLILPRAHLEPCKDWKGSIKYCTKRESWVRGPWVKGVILDKPIKLITKMRKWQQDVIDIINKEPDDRTIHWFWEEQGCTGKTALAKWICSNKNAIVLGGKGADCLYGVAELKDKNDLIVIFDISRITEEYVSYMAIEKIKDGIYFSTKYESKMVIFNSPHVICFSNFAPNEEMLSLDRWHIVEIESAH